MDNKRFDVQGEGDKFLAHVLTLAFQMRGCDDVAVLREVAFAMGEPEPPFFTDLPPAEPEEDQG